MKKEVIAILLATVSAGSVFAGGIDFRELDKLNDPVVQTTFATGFTTYLPSASSEASTESLKNEIALVQDSAAVALEAGIVSSELKSVIEKIRFEYAREFNGASDIEIIEYVFGQ